MTAGALLLLTVETSVPVAVALVEAGADFGLEDTTGRTALDVAVQRGETELCELLLAKGSKPSNRRDDAGNTALHVAGVSPHLSPHLSPHRSPHLLPHL